MSPLARAWLFAAAVALAGAALTGCSIVRGGAPYNPTCASQFFCLG